MAKIKQLLDNNNEVIYPITTTKAVLDNNGKNLETINQELTNQINERYSANNPPPYPVTSVNGKTGAITIEAGGVGKAKGTSEIFNDYTGNIVGDNNYAHAEGQGTAARGVASHAEGMRTTAYGLQSHSEGFNSTTHASKVFNITASSILGEGKNRHGEFIITVPKADCIEKEIKVDGNYTMAIVGIKVADEIFNKNTVFTDDSGALYKVFDFRSQDKSTDPQNILIKIIEPITFTIGNHNFTIIKQGAIGDTSHTEGGLTIATGRASHSEGFGSRVLYKNEAGDPIGAHAEGTNTIAMGKGSHSEGGDTHAEGKYSHAEGEETAAKGKDSHAEGQNSLSQGTGSHAEGFRTESIGDCSHAEGAWSQAIGEQSHAECGGTIARGSYSHAEGSDSLSSGYYSHAEGYSTESQGESSHAEGWRTIAKGDDSHAEGCYNLAIGRNSHSENGNTLSEYIHLTSIKAVEGNLNEIIIKKYGSRFSKTEAITAFLHAKIFLIYWSTADKDVNYEIQQVREETNQTILTLNAPFYTADELLPMQGEAYFKMGITVGTRAIGDCSHSEGSRTISEGLGSHAEGLNTYSKGDYSHTEGNGTEANYLSHAEGEFTIADNYSHAEGRNTEAVGSYCHAEGTDTRSLSMSSHVEGYGKRNGGLTEQVSSIKYNKISNYDHQLVITFLTKVDPFFFLGRELSIIANSNHDTSFCNTIPISVISTADKAVTYKIKKPFFTEEEIVPLAPATSIAITGWRFTTSAGEGAHCEGIDNLCSGMGAHSENSENWAVGSTSHAEGFRNKALGDTCHVEGQENHIDGQYAHGEGYQNYSEGKAAHVEGAYNEAHGRYSHAQGGHNLANGSYSSAGGHYTSTTVDASCILGEYGQITQEADPNTWFAIANGTSEVDKNIGMAFKGTKGAGELFVEGKKVWALEDIPGYTATGNITLTSSNGKFEWKQTVTAGTTTLTPGTSPLATGSIYLVYE